MTVHASENNIPSARGKGITVVGNACVDRIDGSLPSLGGCPAFAPYAARMLSVPCRIVTHVADIDRPTFASLLAEDDLPVTVLPAEKTSAFTLRYDGDRRVLNVLTIGDAWSPEEIDAAAIDTPWVHVAPLLRSDFPPQTLALLAVKKCRVSYDGQGLVRMPKLGQVMLDDNYDRNLLKSIDILKLNDEEAEVIAQGDFDTSTARRLGVDEILVTLGSEGCDVYTDGEVTHVPARRVPDVQSTGAGDAFMVAYVGLRARGISPVAAARSASDLVASMLESRRAQTP